MGISHLFGAGGGPEGKLGQDNAAIHTFRKTINWFSAHKVTLLPWPARSSSLNIVKTSEAIWFVVYENEKQYASVNELIRAIKTAFDSIDPVLFTELYNSMANRLCDDVEKKGGPSKY
ncbi:hypothetical protein WR25_10738 [Diploscapter pachys]|uniref:Tc1-like transposase DDE domain-containing protein n=1 Tax=Diploscapter pachys TaxID=2018661 RepID=A0A2A2JBL0_9BILA|nr:hypothetical protein WR25_10738 [Diploscapter pachys]